MERLFQLIDEEEAIFFLQSLIQINSVNPPGKEKEAAMAIFTHLSDSGLQVRLDDLGNERANIFVTYPHNASTESGRNNKFLVFSGHLDTVPTGKVSWDYPPFSGVVENNKMFGRGTTDMKGGVAAMVLAMKYLYEAGISLNGKLQFVGTAGEEVDGFGAKTVIKKGQIEGTTAIVISEPSNNQAYIAHKGALWLEITTYGKTAHGSMPDHGVNAIQAMKNFLNELDHFDLSTHHHKLLGHSTINVGLIQGGVKTNVVPDQCTVTLDIRTVPGHDHGKITAEMEQLLAKACDPMGASYEIQVVNDMAFLETSIEDSFIQLAVHTAQTHFNKTLHPKGVNYYTDGSVYSPSLGIPVLIYGPGDPAMAHQPNEWLAIDNFIESIRYYMALAIEYLGIL
jgi:succinyl-diaminopimelate desuccinylase